MVISCHENHHQCFPNFQCTTYNVHLINHGVLENPKRVFLNMRITHSPLQISNASGPDMHIQAGFTSYKNMPCLRRMISLRSFPDFTEERFPPSLHPIWCHIIFFRQYFVTLENKPMFVSRIFYFYT